jgi:Holliday junction resolvase RusA-like endonuclease
MTRPTSQDLAALTGQTVPGHVADPGKMVRFFVPGIPRPGGSKTAQAIYRNGVPVMKGGRVIVTTRESGKYTANWRADFKTFALVAMASAPPLEGPLSLTVVFTMPRPRGHYGTGRNAGVLKATAPTWHTSAPDTTKLLRSLEDAVKGIVWRDDAQVCGQEAIKVYGDKPGAAVVVAPCGGDWLKAVEARLAQGVEL